MSSTHPNLLKDNILIVDDDLSARQTLSALMEREGYEVRCAPSGQTALMFAQEEAPDLILLDIRLPDVDGFQVCQRLKENRRTCETPVIFISALEEMKDKIKGFVAGGVDYITKPFQVEEILARVETHLALGRLRKKIEGQNAQLEQEIVRSKQAEEKIKKAAEEWEATFNSISDPVSIHDKEFRIIKANKAFADALGMKPGEVLGKRCYEIIHGTEEPWPNCPHQHALACGKAVTEEFLEPRLGKYLQVSASPIWNDKNEVIGSIHIAQDVSERKRAEGALRRSEQRFRNLVETTSDWVWEVDENGVYTYVSPRIYELLGYQPEEVLGKTPFDLMPPNESERVASIFGPIRTQRAPFRDLENTNQHRDGRLVVLETNGVPFFDTDGRFLGYRGIDRDITERKRAEEALQRAHDELEERVKERTAELVRTNLWLTKEIEERKRAEETLRKRDESLAEAQRIAHLGSYAWDPVADEIKGSEEAYRIFGIPTEVSSITFNEFLELVHPDDRDSVNETARRSLADPGLPIATEYRIIRPDGLERFIYHRGEVTVAEHGKPVRILGTVNDITDYKRAEQALRASEAQLRLMADSLPVLIAYVDREQRYQFNNLAYARWFGLPQDSLKGVSIRKVLGDHAYEGIRGYVEKALAGQEVQFETELPAPGDPGRYVVAHYVPNIDRKSRVLGFYALVQDVTERRQIDLEIQRHREQLAHVSRVATLGELTASLAHELHQPLAAIMSNAQAALRFLAQEDPDLDEVRNILVDIVQDDRRASEVIQRLRQFLRRDKAELTPLDLNGLIQEVMTLLTREAFLRGVTIDVELDAHLPPVVGDRIQLQQVVLNLVLNAADAMAELEPQSRKVIVQTARGDDGEARVAVRDFGTGLDEQNLHCIFDPFYTTKPEGLGMGLAICRSIVDAHGGRLRASNNPDGGATFIFTIPVSRGGEA